MCGKFEKNDRKRLDDEDVVEGDGDGQGPVEERRGSRIVPGRMRRSAELL